MTTNQIPTPSLGRPLTSVLQINKALRAQEDVYCELEEGAIEKICGSSRSGGIFQVQVDSNKTWAPHPRRVWAAKKSTSGRKEDDAASSQAEKLTEKILIERTPIGERQLDDLQAFLFQQPAWLEAPEGSWVILPQLASRRFVFKQWQESRPTQREPTLAGLITRLKEQEWSNRLLSSERETPLRSWLIATPVIHNELS